jgi:hypothetical protein
MTMERPPSASFGGSQRYSAPKDTAQAQTQVEVDGQICAGTILGRNGPRVQVRFSRDGQTFVRWFDTAELAS